MPGPAPDPNAGRRARPQDQATWTYLPPEGRQGEAPTFPFPRATARELKVWRELWVLPQAVAWEAGHMEQTVGAYVRILVKAEGPKGRSNDWLAVLRYQKELGLMEMGLRANRWIIGTKEQTAARNNDHGRVSAKARLTSIEGGASKTA